MKLIVAIVMLIATQVLAGGLRSGSSAVSVNGFGEGVRGQTGYVVHKALRFSGNTTGAIWVTNAPSLRLTNGQPFTIMFWWNKNGTQISGQIISRQKTNGDGYGVYWNTKSPCLYMQSGSSWKQAWDNTTDWHNDTTTSHLFVATCDASQTLETYIDGVDKTYVQNPGTVGINISATSTNTFCIGAVDGCSSLATDLWDLRVIGRVITTNEINAVYSARVRGYDGVTSNTLGRWFGDDRTAAGWVISNSVPDYSGNGYNGNPTGLVYSAESL